MSDYDPDKVSIVINDEEFEGFSDIFTYKKEGGKWTYPVKLSFELKELGMCKGVVYFTEDQYKKFKEVYDVA